jgi:hypothetical protein
MRSTAFQAECGGIWSLGKSLFIPLIQEFWIGVT